MVVLDSGFGSAMVTDHQSKQLPIFAAPSGGQRETKKKFTRGFLRRLAGICVADPVQAGRGKQNSAMRHVAEYGSSASSLEGVKEGDGGSGDL
jgi:hypothetical protein